MAHSTLYVNHDVEAAGLMAGGRGESDHWANAKP